MMEDENLTPGTPGETGAPETPENDAGRREARRCFSLLGLGSFVILAVATLLQGAFAVYINLAADGGYPAWMGQPWAKWVLTFAPLYCIAMPAGLLVMRRAPAFPREPEAFGAGRFLKLIPICIFLMYAGNLLGNVITSLLGRLKGGVVENPLEEYALGGDSVLVKILVMVILAPLLEEFIFRRVLIDRMRVYGEKTAVLTSALIFGLFHGNLSQFFYAFALGLLFGYVYVRTGQLRYSAALHMFVNAMGSVVAPWLLESVGTDKFAELDAASMMNDPAALSELVTPGLLLFLFYVLLLFVLSILGLVLLCVSARRIRFDTAERELPENGSAAIVWGNVGMILFAVACAATIVTSVLM